MSELLALAAAVTALAAIVAEGNGRRHRSYYLLKPLTTLLIAGIAVLAPAGDYRTLLMVGLLLSCAGDIFLMFTGPRWFLAGLSSFLLAHLAFVGAFASSLDAGLPPAWTLLLAVYGLAFFGWLLPKTGALKLPVIVYGSVLLGMAAVAALRWEQLHSASAALAGIGALIFIISDSALAVRQFNGGYRGAQPLILSTYWTAIGLIAASAVV